MTNRFIEGSGGGGGKGGGGSSWYAPVEGRNTLQSKAVANIIDILCEGEIEGFYEQTIEKSIYFNETPLKSSTGVENFQGVSVDFRSGLPDQNYMSGFPSIETEISVNTQLSVLEGPITKTISDANIDTVRVTISIPRLTKQETNGDLVDSVVTIKIKIAPNGGEYVTIYEDDIAGKCISEYERSYFIENLSYYGNAPWNIRLERVTEDAPDSSIQNDTHWVSYTTIINEKLYYPNTALVGISIDSEQFGSNIPSRSFDIKGLKIKIPNNYTVATREYTGEWNGTFKTEWCDNPAWVYYDLLTNDRYGVGLDESMVDKWALYTVAQYCDVYIDDGYGDEEPRFVCNVVINVAAEAIHVLNLLTSIFRGMPLWSSGLGTVIQDRPKDPVKLVTAANVMNGEFNYEGTALRDRHTVVKVTWNDINDFCREQVEYVEDISGISRYGWRPLDITAYGTTSRGQAHRVGKWLLDSELNETEIVHYKASFDQADVLPGDIIELSDPHYTGGTSLRFGGRLISSTIDTVTVDNSITIEGGKDYTLSVVLPDDTLDETINIINSPATTSTLELDTNFATQPQDGAIWMVTVSDLVPRKFRIMSNTESSSNIFDISALYYDSAKFARVEEGIYLDPPSEIGTPTGPIEPPTNFAGEEFQYNEANLALFGIMLSWTHADDSRRMFYDVQSASTPGGYLQEGTTVLNSYIIKPITSGEYDYRVRTVAAGAHSNWVYLTSVGIVADNTVCSGVENLQVLGGGTTFSGSDCEIEWDDSTCHIFDSYRIKTYKIDDTLLRTEDSSYSNYTYTYSMNSDDNNGTAIRDLKFKVCVRDVYNKFSTDATLVVENPAPSMAGLTPTLTQRYGGITIDWKNITPADNDMLKYIVYGDDGTPPTTEIYQCGTDTAYFHWFGLDIGTMYYVQIEPYDGFGPGSKSNIAAEEPVLIPDINIDLELTSSITMSDSDENSEETLGKLYDRNKVSDGISYTVSGTEYGKYIQYGYGVQDIFDRVLLYTADANGRAYVGYSNDGDNWTYLKAEADHSLTVDEELLVATNQTDAVTNYWSLESGTNMAVFPAQIVGKHMRLYLTGSYTTTIYELIFYREVVAEMVVADTLAAITANMGTVTAGVIQSSNLDTTHGILIDLDNDTIKAGGTTSPKFHWDGTNLDVVGSITITAGSYAGDSISTSYTNAKCTDATADKTSTHTSNNTSYVGSCPASTVAGWRYSTTTYINGGDIYTNTVTANKINVTSLSAITADLGTITAGNMTLNTSGFVRTSGKDNYADNTPGFFLGYDGGAYKLNIGSSTKYLKWDGSDLTIGGDVIVTGNIQNNAITVPVSTYVAGTINCPLYATTTVISVQITTHGSPVYINWSCAGVTTDGSAGKTAAKLFRGVTLLQTTTGLVVWAAGQWSLYNGGGVDTPAAGTHTYTLRFDQATSPSHQHDIKNRSLFVMEIRR